LEREICLPEYLLYVYIKFNSDIGGSQLTGDTDANERMLLDKSHIIIATPEKWDAVSRKHEDILRKKNHIRLLMVSV